jgi:hypothetical protein
MSTSGSVAKTYVNCGARGWFFISTMWRESSAMMQPHQYYESLVWAIADMKTGERGEMWGAPYESICFSDDDDDKKAIGGQQQHSRATAWVTGEMPADEGEG